MISLIVANLISQQHLVLVCLSNGPLFKHLLASPSVDFPHVDSCQSMCVNTLVFTSNFLVGEASCSPYCGRCPALKLVFLNTREYLSFLTSQQPRDPRAWTFQPTSPGTVLTLKLDWVCKRQEGCWPRGWGLESSVPGFECLSLETWLERKTVRWETRKELLHFVLKAWRSWEV